MFEYDDPKSGDTIGSILRQQRENKKLNLEDIAEELKIRPRYLQALENDQLDLLPGKLYRRSFLKAYAQFLNLNQDRILEMLEQYESSEESLEKEPHEASGIEKKTEEPKKERNFSPKKLLFNKSHTTYRFVILTILALVIVCLIYVIKPGMKKRLNPVPELSTGATESLSTKPMGVDTTSFEWRLDNLLTNSAPMILRVKAQKEGWVEVIADDKTLFSGIIIPGMAIEFKAHDYFSVNLGKNEGVEFYLNGMKMNPMEKGIYRLDRNNYKSFFQNSRNP
jgi:transcriptional regulator with XRE-family HTH domain